MSEDFIERPRKNEKDGAIQYVKQLLEQALEEHRNEDVHKLEELIRLLQTKKYGLVWEEHAEIVEEEMKTKTPVFVEDTEKKIVGNPDSKNYNFLLEGDNLHSLHLLEKTHGGRIDVIYIDPPYNTGNNDFKYNDKFLDKDDNYLHSKWLSFMSTRLKQSYTLLKNDGIIMVSIDENEYSQLKLLMDEVFGDKNHLSTHHIQVRFSNKSLNEDNDWQPVMEYVLIYAKNKNCFKANKPSEPYDLSKFCYEIIERTPGETLTIANKKVTIFKDGEWEINKVENPGIGFLKETWASGSIVRQSGTAAEFLSKYLIERKSMDGLNVLYKIDNMGEDGLGYRYVTGPKKIDAIRGKFYSGVPLSRQEEIKKGISLKTRPIPNFYDYSADFGNIRHEGKVAFNSGKKPIKMLKQLINYHVSKSAVVLDFFAGSGSTGHAVSQLNKEDGGNRKYILCTNNENNICEEVTYKRLTNIQTELPHNIKYFKTDFVDKNEFPDFQLEDELLNYITPLVELEFGIDISNPSVQIILTEEHLAELIKEGKLEKNSTLFMHSEVFLDSKEEAVLSKLNISRQVIPDYYFGKELWS